MNMTEINTIVVVCLILRFLVKQHFPPDRVFLKFLVFDYVIGIFNLSCSNEGSDMKLREFVRRKANILTKSAIEKKFNDHVTQKVSLKQEQI